MATKMCYCLGCQGFFLGLIFKLLPECHHSICSSLLLTMAAGGSSTTCSRGAGAAALGKKMLMRFPILRQWALDSERKEG